MSVADSHSPAHITVPERHAKVLSAFAKLPAEVQSEVFRAAAAVPVSLSPWDILAESAQQLAGPDLDATAFVSALRGLFYVRQYAADETDEVFVRLAVRGVEKAIGDKAADGKLLQSVVVNVLSLKNLEAAHRAGRVRYDHANHMHDATIITDLRPIFDKEAGTIEGAVVSHTLKIDYANVGEDDANLYIAIDGDDLAKLEAVIKRARRKELTLKAFALNSKLKILEDES